MSFGLDEDRTAIREMALGFAAEHIAPHALDWDRDKTFPVETLRAAAALGMAGIYVREDVGGSGLSRLDATLIFEALSAGCPTVAAFLSIHNMCAWMIDAYGDDDQRRRWLPSLMGMERIASYCLTEPGSGSDAAALRTRAERDGDHYVLSGEKQFISGAGASDLYVCMVRTGEAALRASRRSWWRRARPASPSGPTSARWAGTPSRPGPSASTAAACRWATASARRARASRSP